MIINPNGHQINIHSRNDYGVAPHLYLSITAPDQDGHRRTVSTTMTMDQAKELLMELTQELRKIHATPGCFYINEYHVTRHYGGPEEGGWYYDAGKLIHCHSGHASRANATEILESMKHYYLPVARKDCRPWAASWPPTGRHSGSRLTPDATTRTNAPGTSERH